MFFFQINDIDDLHDIESIFQIIEIYTFFAGDCYIGDLPVDTQTCTDWYIDNCVDISDREKYRDEFQHAEDEMQEYFHGRILDVFQSRCSQFGQHYKFKFDNSTLSADQKDLTKCPIMAGMVLLIFMRQYHAGRIIIYGDHDSKKGAARQFFTQKFSRLFEYIVTLSLFGFTGGPSYSTSYCRSAAQLHELLTRICKETNLGEVSGLSNWSPIQLDANDGGVDALTIRNFSKGRGEQEIYLVSTTIQQSDIKQKIIGGDRRLEFSKFYKIKPGSFSSILARPFDHDFNTEIKCTEMDSIFHSFESIKTHLSSVDVSGQKLLGWDEAKNNLLTELSSINGLQLEVDSGNYIFSYP